ncbi:MAG: hypothetical protein J1F07_05880 [Muribaculaceae bacterium]|nr:hypothetical protein [Muribaculaceae bacterium]
MIVIRNKVLPFGRHYYAINLFGVLFAKGPVDAETMNHEKIHTAQMLELLVLFFYVWYLVEWLIKWAIYRDRYEAYRNISFEREAYVNDHNLLYLKKRRRFSFARYLRKRG